jgi:hypothetical protein
LGNPRVKELIQWKLNRLAPKNVSSYKAPPKDCQFDFKRLDTVQQSTPEEIIDVLCYVKSVGICDPITTKQGDTYKRRVFVFDDAEIEYELVRKHIIHSN